MIKDGPKNNDNQYLFIHIQYIYRPIYGTSLTAKLLQLKVLFQKLSLSGLVLFACRHLENFVLNQGAEITLSESAFLNEVKEQKLDFKNISLMVMHGIRADPSTHISPPPSHVMVAYKTT